MKRYVVIDTNCLVQMLSAHGSYYSAWQAYRRGEYMLCVSNEILNEYQEVIERVANVTVADNVIHAIIRSPHTLLFTPQYRFHLIEQDPDDNKFVDCAIIANADYIVSEDSHFNVLKAISFPSVRVIRLDEFINSIETLP